MDVKNYNPDLIVMDISFPSFSNDINIAEALKSNTEAQIIIVGPTASNYSEKILQSPGVDIVARWEYDFTIKEIADSLEINKGISIINGISYKKNGHIVHNKERELSCSEDLDNIPYVSKIYKKHLNLEDYFLGSSLYPEMQILTGRGCPNNCSFCAWPQTLMGKKYRVRSISNVLDELESIQENTNVKEVFFEDDTFTINKKRVIEFSDEYKKRNLEIAWSCNARVGLTLMS